jgi:AraC family transcriptional regulator, regulatory protein of adaptative response / DNA-3-methyladenine glycosylase II
MQAGRIMNAMNSLETTTTADDARYLALKARDARFDGRFFTGVTSTGIYCRPVCSVKAPRRENCRFFNLAAQAEQAGFRPCLRCRPELAPHSVVWSIQDASYILAHQAAKLLDEFEAPTLVASRTALPPEGAAAPAVWQSQSRGPGWVEGKSRMGVIAQLAGRLGVSERHVRRIFEAQFGVSPLQYLQTRRLHTAKLLLADTNMPITQVALASGFASLRRFNAAFLAHYRLNPTQLRREGHEPGGGGSSGSGTPGITVRLGFRPPYDIEAMLAFFALHPLPGVEDVDTRTAAPVLRRTLRIGSSGRTHTGWLAISFDEGRSQLHLQVSDSLCDVLPLVIRRVRATFDLDADPEAINSALHADFPAGDGLRVPGALDGFELAVRAVLGQQVTVQAGCRQAHRLALRYGEAVETPWPELNRLFPAPAALAAATSDDLGALGIIRQRQAAIIGLSRAVIDQKLALHGGADVQASIEVLKSLPGIGDWTAQYIAMRALRWPDAFPAGDVALHKALGVQGQKNPARLAEAASQAWKPWRSYAVIRAWSASIEELRHLPVPAPPSPPQAAKERLAALATVP